MAIRQRETLSIILSFSILWNFQKKKSPVSDVRPSVLVPEVDTVELATAA